MHISRVRVGWKFPHCPSCTAVIPLNPYQSNTAASQCSCDKNRAWKNKLEQLRNNVLVFWPWKRLLDPNLKHAFGSVLLSFKFKRMLWQIFVVLQVPKRVKHSMILDLWRLERHGKYDAHNRGKLATFSNEWSQQAVFLSKWKISNNQSGFGSRIIIWSIDQKVASLNGVRRWDTFSRRININGPDKDARRETLAHSTKKSAFSAGRFHDEVNMFCRRNIFTQKLHTFQCNIRIGVVLIL